ncbi:related to sulfite oxidase and related enzymes [Lecanosticta acicola]|uniref:Related to sulfite oxidase and related enzymes n=1 Tax=Lecanosticta acicola TaxID=111012 RepID=A0AAI8YXV0_9PEZI|nr:related to sulfite oxidase and related enzymes [Lecanosticta acicola]
MPLETPNRNNKEQRRQEIDDINERDAFTKLDPSGFFIRHPPKPHELHSFITPDDKLFQTIHMGGAVVNLSRWKLKVTGMVKKTLMLDLDSLRRDFLVRTIMSFHECFGSPLKPAIENPWRIGNVRWTGVPLKEILLRAEPLPDATFVWSEGLDRGEYAGVEADCYRKDLPVEKAMCDEVLLAFAMNGEPLSKNRGGPVRLVVPGWFGTNSTKWISKIELQDRRAPGPYTTIFYNVPEPNGTMKPVWKVDVNSMIFRPLPGAVFDERAISVEGWAWGPEGVDRVDVSKDGGISWIRSQLGDRVDFSWQRFSIVMNLEPGPYTLVARASINGGQKQPLSKARNHCHYVQCEVRPIE